MSKNRVEGLPMGGAEGPGQGELGLLDIWGLIQRRKGLLIFGVVAGLALAGLYYSQATPIYKSEAKILVMPRDRNLPTQDTKTVGEFQTRSVTQDILSTHVELFSSPRIVDAAVKKYKLASLPSVSQQKDPTAYIKLNLSVSKGGGGQTKDAQILGASFMGPSPDDCAKILDALVASYQDFLGETFQDTSEEAVKLISQAKADLGRELEQQEKEYQAFRETAPLLFLQKGDQSANVDAQRLAQIENSLAEARLSYAETKSRLDVIEEALKKSSGDSLTELEKISLLGNNDVQRISLLLSVARGENFYSADFQAKLPARQASAQAEHEKLLSLLLRERELLQDYGPDHPEVQDTQVQIKLTQEFLKKTAPEIDSTSMKLTPADVLKAHVGFLQHDLNELEKRQRALEGLAKQEEEKAKASATYELKGQTLHDALVRKQELYNAVVDRLREINLIKDYGGFLTEVISPVVKPNKPVKPVLAIILGLGFVLGGMFGVGLVYVVDIADRTFRNPEEIHQVLQLPVIGHVPELVARNGKAVALQDAAACAIEPTIVIHHEPRSVKSEAIRGLRTAIYFSTRGSGHKVIQITSPHSGDGKTTLISNLAVSIAQTGKRVLLMDCDLRRPTVHKKFGLTSTLGVSNVLVDEAELVEAIQSDVVPNLSVLPSGPTPPNPAELLTLPRFEQLLNLVREQYDFVLVDSPPLLAVSDPCIIAPRVDGVLLAIKIVHNGRPHAIAAREMLAGLNVNVLGVVVNGWDQDRSYGYGNYGSKRGYGYGYTYGSRYSTSGYYVHEDGNGSDSSSSKIGQRRVIIGK